MGFDDYVSTLLPLPQPYIYHGYTNTEADMVLEDVTELYETLPTPGFGAH
jgi:hypothetical protein